MLLLARLLTGGNGEVATDADWCSDGEAGAAADDEGCAGDE